jgi:hypothetical protein
MKGERERRVPLSRRALAILDDMKGKGELVFPGAKAGKPLSNMALLMTLRRMGRGDLTTHGFRSTFRDWCGDHTEFPRETPFFMLSGRCVGSFTINSVTTTKAAVASSRTLRETSPSAFMPARVILQRPRELGMLCLAQGSLLG